MTEKKQPGRKPTYKKTFTIRCFEENIKNIREYIKLWKL